MSQYAGGVGQPTTTAIHKDSSVIINWASRVIDFERGYKNINAPLNGLATFGDSINALGPAEGTSIDIVSLGDNGSIVLTFEHPIKNGTGPDFAVFENGFDNSFLELAHVEVSTDGSRFVRIPSISLTSTSTQTGSFASTDPTKIHNLAGKYKQGYGTPFDLNDILDSTGINLDSINFIKIIDVVGTINLSLGSIDSDGNIINDPFPTEFDSGGFDLDAVGVINENKFVGLYHLPTIDLNIYPNPAQLEFKLSNTTPGLIEIMSLNGEVLYSNQLEPNETIDLTKFKSGVYIVKFSNQTGIATKKLIVN